MVNTTEFANKLLHAGICAVPCKMPEKRPALESWTTFQKVMPKIGQHRFNGSLGVITGAISGNLFVLDCDFKYDLSGDLPQRFQDALGEDFWNELCSKAYIQKTINNGLHIFLKCEQIEGNTKLAQRPATDQEKLKSPHEKVKVLFETRAEGGFIVTAPTQGYSCISGALEEVGLISVEDKEKLFEVCRSFNEVFEEVKTPTSKKFIESVAGISPWEDYNQKADVSTLLESHGWTFFKTVGTNLHYCRPGKAGATSGTYNASLNLFRVFSTSTELPAEKSFSPSALFTYLECKGDFTEAAKRLYHEGFGQRAPNTQTKNKSNQAAINHSVSLFRLTKATTMERPKKILGALWAHGELCYNFGEDGSGKTILSVQIACAIATGETIPGFENELPAQPVTYFDAELSDYQFNNRYPSGLPDNFKRLTFNEEAQAALIKADIDFVVTQIESAAEEQGSKVIILDNLSALTSMLDLTKTSDSIQLMGLLNDLKRKGFSIMVIDHTRKPMHEGEFKIISKNDLQGSKMKSNLADSVFSIGKSCQGENIRYIKALKIRSFEMAYTKNAVATMSLKTDPLRLDFLGTSAEWEHVNDRNSEIMKGASQGLSQAEIAKKFGISQQAISKKLKNV